MLWQFRYILVLYNNQCSTLTYLPIWCTGFYISFGVPSLTAFFRPRVMNIPACAVFSYFFFYWRYNPLWVCILQPSSGAIASSRTRFLDHTQRRAKVGRTPLDEWSVRRRDLYLTTHNSHNRRTSMPPGERLLILTNYKLLYIFGCWLVISWKFFICLFLAQQHPHPPSGPGPPHWWGF